MDTSVLAAIRIHLHTRTRANKGSIAADTDMQTIIVGYMDAYAICMYMYVLGLGMSTWTIWASYDSEIIKNYSTQTNLMSMTWDMDMDICNAL